MIDYSEYKDVILFIAYIYYMFENTGETHNLPDDDESLKAFLEDLKPMVKDIKDTKQYCWAVRRI